MCCDDDGGYVVVVDVVVAVAGLSSDQGLGGRPAVVGVARVEADDDDDCCYL